MYLHLSLYMSALINFVHRNPDYMLSSHACIRFELFDVVVVRFVKRIVLYCAIDSVTSDLQNLEMLRHCKKTLGWNL